MPAEATRHGAAAAPQPFRNAISNKQLMIRILPTSPIFISLPYITHSANKDFMNTPTIFATATAPGKSGVAVIRISGAGAKDALTALGVSPLPAPRIATLAALKDNENIIDKALVLYFETPHSFTGEDVVEIHCHGSRAVINQLLSVLSRLPDYRMAEAGEFTRRAFLNGKMDLTAAEGLADLIDAETEAQRKQAIRIMKGDAALFYEKLRAGILHSLAYLEAYIDFPDEDIPPHVLAEIEREIDSVSKLISAQLGDNSASERIRDGIYVSILGAPNVGKSSLMNLLAKRDIAIVSNIAGTTRDVIEVNLDIDGYSVILSDTAGIREHADIIEEEGIRRSFERAHSADIKIIVLDAENVASGQWSVLESIMKDGGLQITEHNSQATIILLNKSDLTLPSPLPKISGITPIPISVKNKTGLEDLFAELKKRITATTPSESSFITRARHRELLTFALAHLQNYTKSKDAGLELRCEELRRAATEVGKITGKIAVDEILGHIFSSFCIGK